MVKGILSRKGDLYLVVHIEEKPGVWRDGLDLYSKISIDYTEAIVGTLSSDAERILVKELVSHKATRGTNSTHRTASIEENLDKHKKKDQLKEIRAKASDKFLLLGGRLQTF